MAPSKSPRELWRAAGTIRGPSKSHRLLWRTVGLLTGPSKAQQSSWGSLEGSRAPYQPWQSLLKASGHSGEKQGHKGTSKAQPRPWGSLEGSWALPRTWQKLQGTLEETRALPKPWQSPAKGLGYLEVPVLWQCPARAPGLSGRKQGSTRALESPANAKPFFLLSRFSSPSHGGRGE